MRTLIVPVVVSVTLASSTGRPVLRAQVRIVDVGQVSSNSEEDFSGIPSGDVNGILARPGIYFAERFAGQSVRTVDGIDSLLGAPTMLLSLVPGADGENLLRGIVDGAPVLAGKSSAVAISGTTAVLFEQVQSAIAIGFPQLLFNDIVIDFYDRTGWRIDRITVPFVSNDGVVAVGFSRQGGVRDIAGFSLQIGADNPLRNLNAQPINFVKFTTFRGPKFTLAIDGPCGQTLRQPPGSMYDDGTGGADLFFDPEIFANDPGNPTEVPTNRAGHTWDILLRTENNPTIGEFERSVCLPSDPPSCLRSCSEPGVICREMGEATEVIRPADAGAHGWSFGLGTEGPLLITDITTSGTVSCDARHPPLPPRSPECLQKGGFEYVALTGPVDVDGDGLSDGEGPQDPQNAGAVFAVVLAQRDPITLPLEGTEVVCKIRITAEFPATAGETTSGRVFFVERQGFGDATRNEVFFKGGDFNEGSDPPLALEDCVVHLQAATGRIPGDANRDAALDLSDVVWLLSHLFLGDPATRRLPCEGGTSSKPGPGDLALIDANGDTFINLADPVYLLDFLFRGGGPHVLGSGCTAISGCAPLCR